MASSIPPKRQKREAYRATHAGTGTTELPKKKFYRQRAHANPFSDHQLTYPISPSQMDWSTYYPAYTAPTSPSTSTPAAPKPLTKKITVADIGCGFGGLLVALSPLLPNELILGLEIRTQVASYVIDRISALRNLPPLPPLPHPQNPPVTPPQQPYANISILRANTMKFLPNLFTRAQLRLLFLCFPDPHFKARKHKARIVSSTLCAEYAYVLAPGGLVCTITDVEELGEWMGGRFGGVGRDGGGGRDEGGGREEGGEGSGGEDGRGGTVGDGRGGGQVGYEGGEAMFEKVDVPEEGKEDGWGDKEVGMLVRAMREETEEGKKVSRNQGRKFVGIWRRRPDPLWPGEA